ncbi:MAG: murein biosynthesis integral membrane protein MurJ [Planctomycetota bacterium]|nr:murein biosynthesis integral membrane protein MurJ [Planctomycetota bacterium]
MSEQRAGFERHARTVTGLTVLSRLGGLARDATLSRVFGSGAIMDSFWFGFMVPNLFRRLFGEGALSASLLPVFVRELEDDPATAHQVARLLIGRAMLVLSLLVLLAEGVLLTGLFQGELSRGIWLLAIMLPYAPLICLVALLGAMLQAYGRFGPTAIAPIILNGTLVLCSLLLLPFVNTGTLSPDGQIAWVAVSVLLAGVIQVIWSYTALVRISRSRGTPDGVRAKQLNRSIILQALPMAIGLGALQLNTLIDGLIASWPTLVGPTIPLLDIAYPLTEGSMASLTFAQRLYEFPLGVFGIAIATAIFPELSRQHGAPEAFIRTLRRGIRLTLFVGVPASIGLVLVRDPLTAVVLQGVNFTPEDTRRIAFILLGYAPAIWAYSLNQVFVRAFYARGEAMTPVKVAIVMAGLNLVLNLLLIWTPLRVAGLAWSTAICAVLQVGVLHHLLGRKMGGIVDRDVLNALGKILVVSALTMGAALIVCLLMSPSERLADWFYQLVSLLVIVLAGGCTAFITARLLGMPELAWFLGRQVPPDRT